MLLSAVSVKIALFPMHGWLPKAYSAPSAPPLVPAVLSGIYEAAALYLFIRVVTLFSGVIDITIFLFVMGFISGIFGFIRATIEEDIYLILAYSTVSQIGLIVIGVATGTEDGFWGSIFHVLAHSLFKSTLFLVTGDLLRHYGTRDISKIKGVMSTLPVTGIALVLGLLGLTGAPFFNGSISKALIGAGIYTNAMYVLFNVITLGSIIYSLKLADMLVGENELSREIRDNKEPKSRQRWVTLMFGSLTLLTGLFGEGIMTFLYDYQINLTAQGLLQHAITYLILLTLGYFISRHIRKSENVFTSIVGINLSFNSMIRVLVLYFIILASFMYWSI